MMPGDRAKPEDVVMIKKQLGLDKPLMIQLGIWLGRVCRGDFGTSIKTRLPVFESVKERFPVTFSLTTMALVFSLTLGIPSGILSAIHHNTKKDYLFMLTAIFGVSIPGFWLGLISLLLFSVYLGCFPSTGFVPIWEEVQDQQPPL